MKIKVLSLIILLAFMAILPICAARCETNTNTDVINSSSDSAVKSDIQQDGDAVLCGLVAALYKNNYSTETIRALTILLNTDYMVEPQKFDLTDSSVCVCEDTADFSLKELYPQIEDIVNSAKELYLYFDNENVYIPYSVCSNGYTIKDDDYPYLSPVASPWDCFEDDYSENNKCSGVSIDGLNYLCSNGVSAEEALIWYLPDFKVR